MIKPLNGNVVLKKELKENITSSGIVISQKKEEEEFAVVVALSEDLTQNEKETLSVGDKVAFKSYSSNKIKENGIEYIVIPYKDIIAIIK